MADYVSPTISGYNATPPPDDGSETTANEVNWAGIKTKLADPIKTYIDNVNTNVATKFTNVADKTENETITGNYTFSGTMTNSGAVTITGATTMSNTVGISGALTISNTVALSNVVTLSGSGAIGANGNLTIDAPNGFFVGGSAVRDPNDEYVTSFSGSTASGVTLGDTSAHGLGTDDVIAEVEAYGSINDNFSLCWKNADGYGACVLGADSTGVTLASISTPTTGNIKVQCTNNHGATQTLNVRVRVKKRSV